MTRSTVASMALLLLGPGIGPAQGPGASSSDALMVPAAVNQLCGRLGELMEAGGVAVPDLLRAAAPVIENTRQDCIQLRLLPGRGRTTYSLLMNLRSYLALADSVPKPYPFPEAAQKQLTELRDDATRLDAHFRALIENRDRQLASPDPANLGRYAEANRKVGPAVAGKPRVVFFGDSITDFWRLNEYFPDRDFVNRGISGQITGEMLGRMKADVIDLHPGAVVILAGTNDLGRGIPLTVIENNYLMMVDLASLYKIKVIFASVLPVSDYHKNDNPSYERTKDRPPLFINALNEWIGKLCSQRGLTYLNYFPALVDSNGQLKEDLSDDGLHPNSKGYRLMAPLALEAVQKTLRTAVAPAPAKPSKRPGTSN